MVLSSCENQIPNSLVSWEKIDLQKPDFLQKPVFQAGFLKEADDIES
jgi:hypothetical protein